jgi:type II secretory pathway component GspD/PulD (secretin)
MPRVGDPQDRNQKMHEIFQKFYQDPANAGQDLSIPKANAEMTKTTGHMLRNKVAYEIRRQVKAGLRGQHHVPAAAAKSTSNKVSLYRQGPSPVATGALLVKGTPEQLQFLVGVLGQAHAAGLGRIRIDYSTSEYAVLVADSAA